MAAIRDCGHIEFTPSAFDGPEKEPQRIHIATIPLISTRGDSKDFLTSCDDLQDDRQMFLLLVEKYSGKHDDDASAMAAQDTIALNTYM